MSYVAELHTDGNGLWSSAAKSVRIVSLKADFTVDEDDEERKWGELRVYFDDSWNVYEDGLIYTDRRFERELKEFLTMMGYAGNDVSYSEQGMQGDDYVSCDIGSEFIDSWLELGPGIHIEED